MPKLAVIAPNATGVQPPFALFVGGTDVLKDYSGAAYGTPLGSIEVTEQGPGGVSTIEFDVDDPAGIVTLDATQVILFWNYTADVPLFRGYVDHWSYTPDFGGQGRRIHVTGTGVEVWLDWLVSSASFQGSGINAPPTDMAIAANLVFSGNPLSIGIDLTGGGRGERGTGIGTPGTNVGGVIQDIVPAGTTLRDTMRLLQAMARHMGGGGIWPQTPPPVLVTVDWYFTLRVWADRDAEGGALQQPDDYTTLTVTDTTVGANVAENLEYTVEPGDVMRGVYVIGGNPAGTLFQGDGSGVSGRQAVLADTTILDADTARARARAVLAEVAPLVRGSFTLSDWSPASTIHAGSLLTLTDTATGSTGTYRIYQIRKTFTGARQTWVVSFGGNPPSAMNLLRKLTRSVAA